MRMFVLCLCVCLSLVGSASGSRAQTGDPDVVDELVHDLDESGFTVRSVEWTWLGRVRVLAYQQEREREVVIDPRNGLILRDYIWSGNGNDRISGPSVNRGSQAAGGTEIPAGLGDDDDDSRYGDHDDEEDEAEEEEEHVEEEEEHEEEYGH
ncbi:hypothetical protein HKCCE3408_11340 [Rhodobacterales bacterium HKCCE3408]|nr:hypothetical protein [Rhodobacterales bacterium HKCCE3408]